MNTKIDNSLTKEALLNFNNVSRIIKESANGATKELMKESLRELMSDLITESDDENIEDKNDKDEVKDAFDTDFEQDSNDGESEEIDDEEYTDAEDDEVEVYGADDVDSEDDDLKDSDADSYDDAEDESDEEEWEEFEKYKVGDEKYDFTSADETDLQSVFSILKNDDNIDVRQEGDNVYAVDNGETEFIIIPTDANSEVEISTETDDLDDNGEDYFGGVEDMVGDLVNSLTDGEPFVIDLCQDGECEDGDDVYDECDDETDATPNETAEDSVDYENEPLEDDDDDEQDNNVKENRIMRNNTIFEVTLNEDNLGYTDHYQDKTAMDDGIKSNDGTLKNGNVDRKATPFKESRNRRGRRMNEEAYQNFPNTDVWDEVPGNAGTNYADEDATPFEDKIGNPLEEEYEISLEEEDELPIDEGAGRYGFVQKRSVGGQKKVANKDIPYMPYGSHRIRTAADGYKGDVKVGGEKETTNESKRYNSILMRTNKVLKENAMIKKNLKKFEQSLQEAAIANINLKNALRLVTENTTSANEKKSIVKQFANVKSVNESKMLYNSIKKTLNGGASKANLNESKQQPIAVKATPINETVIYKSNGYNESLDLMSRMNKVRL